MTAYVSGFDEAKQRAQANADYFGRPYYVTIDSSGNYRTGSEKPTWDGVSWAGAALVAIANPKQSESDA